MYNYDSKAYKKENYMENDMYWANTAIDLKLCGKRLCLVHLYLYHGHYYVVILFIAIYKKKSQNSSRFVSVMLWECPGQKL